MEEHIHNTKVLLCLYYLYGNPAECKLALVRGGVRAYGEFKSSALPFVLNVFARDEDKTLKKKRQSDFFRYIARLQTHYLKQLQAIGLSNAILPADAAIDIPEIQQYHETICLAEGKDCNNPLEEISSAVSQGLALPQHMLDNLRSSHYEASATYKMLNRFYLFCERNEIRPYHSLDQCMFDFMAFLTHFARAYVFEIRDKHDAAIDDIKQGTSHLKRVVLDMRKAIVTTLFRNASQDTIVTPPADVLKKLLFAREKELSLGTFDNEKIMVYKSEIEMLMQFYGF